MVLPIENDEAVRLVQELADATGESVTAAVTNAVREKLERTRKPSRAGLAERLIAIAKETGPRFKEPFIDHGEFLYGDDGLPR